MLIVIPLLFFLSTVTLVQLVFAMHMRDMSRRMRDMQTSLNFLAECASLKLGAEY